jgi:hypothetical protein
MRSARPAGVRSMNQASRGTSASASSVSGVCCASTGTGSHDISANGVIVGGVVTFGKPTR